METVEVQAIQKVGNALIEVANTFTVENQEQADEANDILKNINKGLKLIEEKRKSFTSPLNKSLKEINATFKAITEPINEAKQGLTTRLMGWRTAEQARIRQEQEKARKEEERRRKIQESHAAKGHKVKEDITPVSEPTPFGVIDNTKTQFRWTYEIEDEAMIPRQYLQVNGPAITKAVRDGVRDIPGVKIYQKETPIFG